MLSKPTGFSLAGLRRIVGVAGPHSSGMATTATNLVLVVGRRPALQRFGEGRSAYHVPERPYVNFVLQGGRSATERNNPSGYRRPAIVGRDRSCPTMSRLVNNQTRFYKVPAFTDRVNAAKPMGITLYERASGAVRYLLDNIRVVK